MILHIWSGCGGLLNGPITGRPPPMPWGMGGPIAALAVSRCAVPQTARCIRAGRGSPRVGTYRTRSQRVSDQEDRTGVFVFTREAPREGSGVHTPKLHRQPPLPSCAAHCLAPRPRAQAPTPSVRQHSTPQKGSWNENPQTTPRKTTSDHDPRHDVPASV